MRRVTRLLPLLIGLLAGCGDGAEAELCSVGFGCPAGEVCLAAPASTDMFCAVPNPACDSGWRWGDQAGDALAKMCVAPSGAGLTASPADHPFGDVPVGTTAPSITIVVSNSGSLRTRIATATIAGQDASAFPLLMNGCMGVTLAPGASCELVVTFTASAGMRRGNLVVNGTVLTTLSGTGVAAQLLAISPASHDFMSVIVGAVVSREFIITNSGATATGNLSVTTSGDLTVTADTCSAAVLAASASCAVSVQIATASVGARSGDVRVFAAPGGSVRATVTASVVTNAALEISPTGPSFGSVLAGAFSTPVPFTIRNAGGLQSGPLTLSFAGANADDWHIVAGTDTCSGIMLAAAATCTVSARFQPIGDPGEKIAQFRASAIPGGTATATLVATQLAPASLTVAAAPTFTATGVGHPTDATVALTNPGGVATGVITIVPSGDFAAVSTGGNDCLSGTTTLAAGASCTLRVRFTPTATGTRSGGLALTASPGGNLDLALSAVGLTPAAISAPATLAFGTVQATSERTITVTNTGQETTGPIDLLLSGEGVGAYQVVATMAGDCVSGTTTLAMNATCTARVRFTPPDMTLQEATLTISGSPGGAAVVALTGTGQ